jgi:hypothetical protein
VPSDAPKRNLGARHLAAALLVAVLVFALGVWVGRRNPAPEPTANPVDPEEVELRLDGGHLRLIHDAELHLRPMPTFDPTDPAGAPD